MRFRHVRVNKVFPARAGMSRIIKSAVSIKEGVPRASGDEPGIRLRKSDWDQCSPRERG